VDNLFCKPVLSRMALQLQYARNRLRGVEWDNGNSITAAVYQVPGEAGGSSDGLAEFLHLIPDMW